MPVQIELLDYLYESAWQQLDTNTKCFWLSTWLLPPELITHETAVLVSHLDKSHAVQAAQQLQYYSLLKFDPATDHYVLHSVARAYLKQKITTDQFKCWRQATSQRLSGIVLGAPNAAQIATV